MKGEGPFGIAGNVRGAETLEALLLKPADAG
jgi:hypothetical protein